MVREFRFLRKLMDLTQGEAYRIFWGATFNPSQDGEKGKADVNGAADKLTRILYLGSKCSDIDAPELIKKVAALDARVTDRQMFEETDGSWKAA